MQLIAKCETRQSLFNFKAITQEADAVMLSRGNLGLDVLPEKMALVQKHVIQQCNMLGKPVIVTRVVDTMVTSPRPTRYGSLASPFSPTALALAPFPLPFPGSALNLCCDWQQYDGGGGGVALTLLGSSVWGLFLGLNPNT